jgi:transcriptional antiterminator RfaH
MAECANQRSSAGGKMRHEPLFPRYLFLNAAPELQSLAALRSTRGAVGLVRAGSELIKIPASIIAGLKARTDRATGLIALDSIGLNNGDKVRVFDGPFVNLEGVFMEHRGRTRSLLLLEILGRATAVEIDARMLQRVS